MSVDKVIYGQRVHAERQAGRFAAQRDIQAAIQRLVRQYKSGGLEHFDEAYLFELRRQMERI